MRREEENNHAKYRTKETGGWENISSGLGKWRQQSRTFGKCINVAGDGKTGGASDLRNLITKTEFNCNVQFEHHECQP